MTGINWTINGQSDLDRGLKMMVMSVASTTRDDSNSRFRFRGQIGLTHPWAVTARAVDEGSQGHVGDTLTRILSTWSSSKQSVTL